ncbi:signal peptidase II [Candidatus Riflebacteria bacterium]
MKEDRNRLLIMLDKGFRFVNDVLLFPITSCLKAMGITPEFSITLAVIALDQFSKYLAKTNFKSIGDTIPLMDGVFSLTYVQNYGVAFGLFKHRTYLPIVMAGIMILIVLYYIKTLTEKEYLTKISLALLMGGAIGNLIDRLYLGYVVDFFDWHYMIKWPVFNFADVFIDVAVGILFLEMIFMDPDEEGESNRSMVNETEDGSGNEDYLQKKISPSFR